MCGQKNLITITVQTFQTVSLVHTKLEKMLSITIYKLLNVVIQEKTS